MIDQRCVEDEVRYRVTEPGDERDPGQTSFEKIAVATSKMPRARFRAP